MSEIADSEAVRSRSLFTEQSNAEKIKKRLYSSQFRSLCW